MPKFTKRTHFIATIICGFFLISVLSVSLYIYIQTRSAQNELTSNPMNLQLRFEPPANLGSTTGDAPLLERLRGLYEACNESDLFAYYEIFEQFMYVIDYSGPQECIYGYDYGHFNSRDISTGNGIVEADSINCIQISQNSLEIYNIQVTEGRNFTAEDYFYRNNATIPVILGHSFAASYKVGEIMSANYLGTQTQLQVIGFLSKGEQIKNMDNILPLDRHILMPMFNFYGEARTVEENAFLVRHYMNKLSGYIKPINSSSFQAVSNEATVLSNNVGLGDIEIFRLPYVVNIGIRYIDNYMAMYIYSSGFIISLFLIIAILIVSRRHKVKLS